MKRQTGFWLLLLAVLTSARGQVRPSYFEVGGNLELRPSPTEPITEIVWRHNDNPVAVWLMGGVDLTYYGQFRGRTTLNLDAGALKIQKMTAEDVGSYTVEINRKLRAQSYEGKVIQRVGKPSVVIQLLTCNSTSESCTLICDGATPEVEPVEYSWKKGDEKMEARTKEMIINPEMDGVKTFSCSMKNPVSEAESDPEKNPYYQEKPPVLLELWKIVLRISLHVAFYVITGFIMWRTRDIIRKSICPRQDKNGTSDNSA